MSRLDPMNLGTATRTPEQQADAAEREEVVQRVAAVRAMDAELAALQAEDEELR